MTNYIEKNAKTVLRKSKYTDTWFVSKYRFNVYRGCENACAYCDGRNEKYNTTSRFGEEIEVKVNILELLKKEISRIKEKTILSIGGGVGDSYQSAEKKYQLTRSILKFLKSYNFPVHILTKSSLIERDLDLLKEINDKNKSVISLSFSTNNQKIVDIFEPGCAVVKERFKTLESFKKNNFYTGIMYMPVIPFVSDSADDFKSFLKDAKNTGVDFILFGGMTLKDGNQKDHFYSVLDKNYPGLAEEYDKIYYSNIYGSPKEDYYTKISNSFYSVLSDFKIPPRIPHYIYRDKIELKDEVAMILFHIYFLLSLKGENKKFYEIAAWNILKLEDDIAELAKAGQLEKIKGVGKVIGGIIKEVVLERKCTYYERLLYN
jgi:DNA repair photolyase